MRREISKSRINSTMAEISPFGRFDGFDLGQIYSVQGMALGTRGGPVGCS